MVSLARDENYATGEEEEPAVKAFAVAAVTRTPKGCNKMGRCSDDQRGDYQNRLNNTFQSIELHLTLLIRTSIIYERRMRRDQIKSVHMVLAIRT